MNINTKVNTKVLKKVDNKKEYIERAKSKLQKFVMAEFDGKIIYLDVSTVDNPEKVFFHIPFSGFIDGYWNHVAFKAKMSMMELYQIIDIYDTSFDEMDESIAIREYPKIDNIKAFSCRNFSSVE